jgi:hypothetical protein
MRYLCVHCDAPFEAEDPDKPRCPSCLRTQGLRPLQERAASASGRARWPWVVGAVVLCGAAAAGYFVLRPQASIEGPTPMSPLSDEELAARLVKASVDAGPAVRLLHAGAAVRAFAEPAVAGAATPADKAAAVAKAIAARASAQAFVRPPLVEVRPEPAVRGAEETATALGEDGARHALFPLEVTALGVAALRSVGVPAMLAEVYAFAGDTRPADPSGRVGYFAVALPKSGGGFTIHDVYAGRTVQPAAGDFAVLDDLAAVGMALSLSALVSMAANEEPTVAVALVDAAAALAPSSPSVRCARGTVLLASSGTDEGVREMEAAAQLRRDGPRRNNLAMIYLAKGERDRGAKEVSLALEQFPDFAAAHVTLASVHLAAFEREQARAELERAEALEPGTAMLLLAWAQYHASGNELPQALVRAKAAVALRPDDPQTHLTLARMYRLASDFDPMRVEAHRVMELTAQSQRDRMRELLEAVLGPTALETPVEVAEVPDAGAAALGEPLPEPGDLDLSAGSSILGSGKSDAPHLGGSSDLNLEPGGSKLRLRAPGSKLRLDLGE